MHNVIAVFVGLLLFFMMIAIKKLVKVDALSDGQYKKNRLRNIGCLLALALASVCLYYIMCRLAGIHLKLCCIYKSGMITLALYSVYRQFFGLIGQPMHS